MAAKQCKTGLPKSAGNSPPQTSKVPAKTALDPQLLEALQHIKEDMKEIVKETIEEKMQQQLQFLNTALDEKFQEVVDDVIEIKQSVDEQHNKIRDDIIFAFKTLAAKVGQLEEKIEQNESKIEEVQTRVDKTDGELILTQYKLMEFALRIRGLKEDSKEDLTEIFSEALAQEIGIQSKEMAEQIDKIYRANSWIARQRQLPRDVVIYFTNRRIRNEILQAAYRKKFQVAGKDILVLKEIPSQMLKGRKEYAFLAEELRKRQIQFRWEIPAGISVTYEGVRYRLNTVSKAREFYLRVLKAGQHPSSPEAPRRKEIEDSREREEQRKQARAQARETPAFDLFAGFDPKQQLEPAYESLEQMQTRATTKRKEEELKMQQYQAALAQGTSATASEAMGGARPKVQGDLEAALLRLQGARDGN